MYNIVVVSLCHIVYSPASFLSNLDLINVDLTTCL